MAARFEVSRSSQDEFAVRSHHLAEKAWQDGHLGKEVVEVALAPNFVQNTRTMAYAETQVLKR